MIKIKFLKKNERIIYFEITGHANHGEYGEDIVCSSVSSVSQMTLNGLLEILKLDGRLQYEETEGYIVCDLDKSETYEWEDTLSRIVEFELIPLLNEYWFDDVDMVNEWSNNLRSAIK